MGKTGYANGVVPRPLEERLMAMIRKGGAGECRWQWAGYINNKGYGTVARGPKNAGPCFAHREVYRLCYERPIPEGKEIDHLCGRGARGCVTPEHLEAVTRSENQRRSNYRRWHGVRQGT